MGVSVEKTLISKQVWGTYKQPTSNSPFFYTYTYAPLSVFVKFKPTSKLGLCLVHVRILFVPALTTFGMFYDEREHFIS